MWLNSLKYMVNDTDFDIDEDIATLDAEIVDGDESYTETPRENVDIPMESAQIDIPDPELEAKSPRLMMYGLIAIVAIFALIFGVGYLKDTKFIDVTDPVTGGTITRPSDDCYMFNGNEFCQVDDIWYTDFRQGNTIYTGVGFHYDPKSVKDIEIEGTLSESFLNSDVYYVTFDPNKEKLGYTALASAELQLSLARAMNLPLKAACTTNHTGCIDVPVITCDNTEKPVFFVNEAEETSVVFDGNCVTVSGQGMDLTRAVDRLLYFWYGIMV